MNNKKFLVVTVVIVIAAFIGLSNFNKNSNGAKAQVNVVSSDILIKFHSPVKGVQNAPVTIVEFLDPECEACRAMHPIMKRLLTEY